MAFVVQWMAPHLELLILNQTHGNFFSTQQTRCHANEGAQKIAMGQQLNPLAQHHASHNHKIKKSL